MAAVRRFQKRVNELAGYDVLDVTGKLDAQSLAFLDYYAEEWAPIADAIWAEKPHPEHKYENFKNWHPKDDPADWYSNKDSMTDYEYEDDRQMAIEIAERKAAKKAACE